MLERETRLSMILSIIFDLLKVKLCLIPIKYHKNEKENSKSMIYKIIKIKTKKNKRNIRFKINKLFLYIFLKLISLFLSLSYKIKIF